MTASSALDVVIVEVEVVPGAPVINWILNSWLKSNRDNGGSLGHGSDFDTYWTMHERLAKRLLRGGRVLLAHWPDSPDTFVGWACFDDDALHYVYTKRTFRRGHVATQLLNAAGQHSIATHAPAPTREWARQWLLRRGCICSPYALIEGIHTDADFKGRAGEASRSHGAA